MSFAARYPGRCNSCDERIHEGDLINMTDHGAVHEDCIEATHVAAYTARAEPAPCFVCWLVHPVGTCGE